MVLSRSSGCCVSLSQFRTSAGWRTWVRCTGWSSSARSVFEPTYRYLRSILTPQQPIEIVAAVRAIRAENVAVYLPDVPFLPKAAALRYFPTADIGFITSQPKAMGAEMHETGVLYRPDCLRHKALALMGAIDKIADLELRQRPTDRTDV